MSTSDSLDMNGFDSRHRVYLRGARVLRTVYRTSVIVYMFSRDKN